MPIRFRCRHCNQLMGIARRKAGMTVQCPTCRAEVVVPQPESEAPPPPAAQPIGDTPAPLFERSDFEAFLQNPVVESPAAPPPPHPPSPFVAEIPSTPAFSPPSAVSRAHPAGLVLSPTQATWLTVAVILLVALAFGAGLLVGHYWIG
jgi:phage FluMu protein Com